MKSEWQSRWQTGRTGWDLGRAHAQCEAIYALVCGEAAATLNSVLVPGCGSGHEAAFFAQKKLQVTAVDYVAEALAAGRKLYGQVDGLEWRQADCLDGASFSPATFDLIVDRAMLCAIHPDQRLIYLANCLAWLKPSAFFSTILFSRKLSGQDQGPPYMISVDDFCKILPRPFVIRDVYEYETQDIAVIDREVRIICQKIGEEE